MKLMTNFKDYYDFLIQKYWIDEKAFYNRVIQKDSYIIWLGLNDNGSMGNWFIYAIAFCWYIISVAKMDWKFYFWDEINLNKINTKDSYYNEINSRMLLLHWEETEINDVLNCPVILLAHESWFTKDTDFVWQSKRTGYTFTSGIRNIKLTNFWIDKFIPAEDAFIQISNFLIREKQFTNNQSNTEKIESHWFDNKRSFRPKMK